jgi:hypothetical protein
MKKEQTNEVLAVAVEQWFELVLATILLKRQKQAVNKKKIKNGKEIHN